jgi:hypothetical protein
MGTVAIGTHREPWNKSKIVGQKAPFKLKDLWAPKVRLQMGTRVRKLALFKLRHELAGHWRDLEVEPCTVTVLREAGRGDFGGSPSAWPGRSPRPLSGGSAVRERAFEGSLSCSTSSLGTGPLDPRGEVRFSDLV